MSHYGLIGDLLPKSIQGSKSAYKLPSSLPKVGIDPSRGIVQLKFQTPSLKVKGRSTKFPRLNRSSLVERDSTMIVVRINYLITSFIFSPWCPIFFFPQRVLTHAERKALNHGWQESPPGRVRIEKFSIRKFPEPRRERSDRSPRPRPPRVWGSGGDSCHPWSDTNI